MTNLHSDLRSSAPNLEANLCSNQRNISIVSATESNGKRSERPFNGRAKSKNVCARMPARVVLYLMSWSGFLVSFMMRNDINIAIIKMTAIANVTSSNATTLSENSTASLLGNDSSSSSSQPTVTWASYNWSSELQSVIQSSFFWCYVLAQLVGGIATQHFGTKQVFGWSQFATALGSLCIPYAASLHYSLVILMRSIQGFASGLTWPAMYAVVGYWIPQAERSRFMSSFQGFSMGTGLSYFVCGFIIEYVGWEYAFYTTGTLGMLWCVFWCFLGYNTPQQHPRIDPQELRYIESNITADQSLGMKVPWKSIFLSMPAWAIAITTFGRIWITYVFIIGGPKFMNKILKFNYVSNGLISGLPHVLSYFASVLFCYVADKLSVRDWMSLTNVRKLFTALSQIVPAVLLYAIGYCEENLVVLLVNWFVAIIFISASYAGAMANIVDIAPNLAGPVLAFCQTIHMSASFMSPLFSGFVITDEQNINQWRTVFTVAAVIAAGTYAVFQIYGTADIQTWNYEKSAAATTGNSATPEERPMLKINANQLESKECI